MNNPCAEIIKEIYNHNDIVSLISKIHPESIRDDLRQELALTLLEQPCDKISGLMSENNLIKYAMRTCWNMATGSNNKFYRMYKRSDLAKAAEYLRLMQHGYEIPYSVAFKASEVICNKQVKDVFSQHEAAIFNKYIELGGVRAVARYYGIPAMHVSKVVRTVRQELKQVVCGL